VSTQLDSATLDAMALDTVRKCVHPLAVRHPTTLGSRVRWHRQAIGASQGELASTAGVSRTSVSNIERDRFSPKRLTLAAIAAALGVTVAELRGETAAAERTPEDERR
jgi:transcriptional regulator with XRE-family HTH domain